jgi:hypothetical protein
MQRLAAALAVAAIIGGCGASGREGGAHSGSTDSTPPWRRPYGLVYVTQGLRKGRFTTHFNTLCRRSWRRINDPRASYFDSITFYIYSAIQRFGTPRGERGPVEHLLVTMQEGVEQGERTRITAPARVEALFADYNRAARRIGLDECLVAGAHLPHREA